MKAIPLNTSLILLLITQLWQRHLGEIRANAIISEKERSRRSVRMKQYWAQKKEERPKK
ncbi:MAG: hypothetical protein ACTS81_04995 [Arsenophonus sp. ER-BJ3-MAG3]